MSIKSTKLNAGADFPKIVLQDAEGNPHELSQPTQGADWKMVVVYRGRHCPMCTKFLNKLEAYKERLLAIGIDIIAVSGDSLEQLQSHLKKLNVTYPLTYGLNIEQMQELGLYISHPRSEKETDHPFAEPGLFVINDSGRVQVVDQSNNPFARPELEVLVGGLEWIRNPENNYPIRGTYPHKVE